MNLKHINAVAFDLDGTLVDSIPDLAAAANAMREHLDLPPLPALRIQEHVGDGIASLVHRALTNERDGQADPALWERGYVFFIQYYREHLSDNTSIYPGVTDGLGLLRALQLPLAVITNKSERLALPLLEQLGLRDHFSLIIGGDTLAEKKPSALPLQHVCQVLGIARSKWRWWATPPTTCWPRAMPAAPPWPSATAMPTPPRWARIWWWPILPNFTI